MEHPMSAHKRAAETGIFMRLTIPSAREMVMTFFYRIGAVINRTVPNNPETTGLILS